MVIAISILIPLRLDPLLSPKLKLIRQQWKATSQISPYNNILYRHECTPKRKGCYVLRLYQEIYFIKPRRGTEQLGD